MKAPTFIILCAAFLMVLPSASAQKVISKKQWKKTTRVTCSYDSGSLPAQHKTDYSISVDKDSIIVKVYSKNGTGIERFVSSPEILNSVKAKLAAMELGRQDEDPDSPRPRGGYTVSVACYAGSECYFSAYEHSGYGTLYTKDGAPLKAFTFTSALPASLSTIIDKFTKPAPQLQVPSHKYVSEEDMANATLLRYDFTDSSTSPEHHRSYSIVIGQDSIVVEVWSYSDLLLHTVYSFNERRFMEVKRQLYLQGISKGKRSDEPIPDGGEEHALAFYRDGECFFSASSYAGIGTLYIDKGQAADAFYRALPEPINTIIDQTRNNDH